MHIETIISEYEKQGQVIATALRKQGELVKAMKEAQSDDYDWISVKEASKRLDVTTAYLYGRKDLEQKHIGSRIFLRWSQCKAIDDKFAGAN